MDWREAAEEESKYIKRKYIPGEIFGIIIVAFFTMATLGAIPLAIHTIIKKGSIPFAIFSILVQIVLVLFALLLISVIVDEIKKVIKIQKNDYRIADCVIEEKKAIAHYKRTEIKLKVKTSGGKKYTVKPNTVFHSGFKKGEKVFVIEIATKKDKEKIAILKPDEDRYKCLSGLV